MKKTTIVVTFLLVSIMLFSCGTNLSDLNQITATDIKCSVNQSKADQYYEKYGNNNSRVSGYDKLKLEAFQRLSNVPEEYLQYVFVKNNVRLTLNVYEGAQMSWTDVEETDYKLYPTGITITFMSAITHEFGHATEGSLWDQYPSIFKSDLEKISAIIAQKYQSKISQYLRSYANQTQYRARDAETFAELFDTWYCSKQSREIVKQNMPEVYQFAQKYLIAPEGADDITSSGASSPKNVNIFFHSNKIYFGNNKNYSNIQYCVSTSSDDECSDRISSSSFSNKSGKKNLFVSDKINLEGHSSFTLFIYGDDSLVRKVSISK